MRRMDYRPAMQGPSDIKKRGLIGFMSALIERTAQLVERAALNLVVEGSSSTVGASICHAVPAWLY
jgi:hypothetical protein